MFNGLQVTPLADAEALLGALQDVRPTLFGGVPRVWEKLKAGVEAMLAYEPDQAKRQAMQQAFEIAQRYVHAAQAGAVPAGLAGAYRRADEQVMSKIRFTLGLDQVRAAVSGAARIGTVGKALPGVELELAGDGELLVRGPIVMKGYRNDPAKTAEAIDADGWLHTGDVATIDDDGYVRITGRKKDLIINAAGKNISPSNIENARLAVSPLIGPLVAIGDRRPYIVALIVLDPDAAAFFAAQNGVGDQSAGVLAGHRAVRAAVGVAVKTANGKLSRVEQIKRFAILPEFWEPGGDELTPTMKLKRRPVAAKYAGIIESMYAAAGEPA